MKTLFDDVGEFHAKFGLPCSTDPEPCGLLDESTLNFRINFMKEELKEFIEASQKGDLVGATDALCDLVYVALGTAHMMRVPFDECWQLVQEANLTKVRANGADDPRSKRSHAFDVVKPEGFVPPEVGIARLIEERNRR